MTSSTRPHASFRSIVNHCVLASLLIAPLPADDAPAYEHARVKRLRADIEFLASDALAGRDSGEAGLEVAAEYVAERFRRIGLEPAGDRGTYYHHFAVPGGARFAGRPGAVIATKDGETFWTAGSTVEAFGFGKDEAVVDAPLVFAGYGIQARGNNDDEESFTYDDFAKLDVRGKVVLHFRYHPRWKRADQPFGRNANRYAAFVSKLEKLAELGAAGAIIVTPPGQEEEDLYGVCHRASPRDATLPVLFARRDAVDALLRRHGKDLEAIHSSIEESLKPVSFELDGVRVRFHTTRRYLRLRNIVGRLPGADETLSSQNVVVGGHYDHIGRYGNQVAPANLGEIHNGADDNASGITGVIEVARLLAAGPRPKRSLIFMGFSGEELGLHGSRAWVDENFSSSPPKREIVAMVNLDMIGRAGKDGGVTVLGVASSPPLADMVKRLAEKTSVPVRVPMTGGGFGGSDHMSFMAHQVPVLFFNTGMPRVYNTPEDDAETINFEAEARICDLVLGSTVEIANAAEAPRFDAESLASSRRRRGPRLGVRIAQDYDGPGARVEQVSERSVASRAGMRDGDTILAFAGEEVAGFPDLVNLIQSKGKGKVKIRVQRGEEKIELEAEFASR